MANEVMDWEGAYRQEGEFEGPPPWNIGEPQPELAALAAAGKFRSDVLDAGCGYAELSLTLAADGYTVHGVDLTSTAVAAATKAAAGAWAEQRHLRAGRHHRVQRTRRPLQHRRRQHLFHRCPSRAATGTCGRCIGRRPTAPAISCWCSPRGVPRRVGAEAERGRRGRITFRGKQILGGRRDSAGVHSRAHPAGAAGFGRADARARPRREGPDEVAGATCSARIRPAERLRGVRPRLWPRQAPPRKSPDRRRWCRRAAKSAAPARSTPAARARPPPPSSRSGVRRSATRGSAAGRCRRAAPKS